MPDETDTLTSSQTSSQLMDQWLGNDLTNSVTSSQSLLSQEANTLSNSQTSTQSLVDGRIPIPIITIIESGIDPGGYSFSDVISKHSIENLDQRTAIEVVSIDGSPQTVTIITSYVQEDLNLEDRVVTIPAGGTKYIGPFPKYIYNHGITTIYLDPSVSGTLKFRAFRLIA